jgi:hypothetical protein
MMESKKQLREILNNGEAVVLPTETVYGLFAKALDEKAVDYVYELKNRPRDKAMNLNVASYEDILFYSKEQPKYFVGVLPQHRWRSIVQGQMLCNLLYQKSLRSPLRSNGLSNNSPTNSRKLSHSFLSLC